MQPGHSETVGAAPPPKRHRASGAEEALASSGLFLLSLRPRLWVWDGFLSQSECALLRGAVERGAHGEGSAKPSLRPEEQEVMDSVAKRIGELVGTAPHPAETPLAARRTPTSHPGSPDIFLGLHVDTFQGSPRRFVTGLMYLNGGVRGGETAFPLAEATEAAHRVEGVQVQQSFADAASERAAAAADSEVLLGARCFHTTAASTPTLGDDGGYEDPPEALQAAAARLLNFAERGRGLRVQPREGRLILFFTRTETGEVDPYSWHGGCAVRDGGEQKMTLQAFKQIPDCAPKGGATAANLESELSGYIEPRLARLLDGRDT